MTKPNLKAMGPRALVQHYTDCPENRAEAVVNEMVPIRWGSATFSEIKREAKRAWAFVREMDAERAASR